MKLCLRQLAAVAVAAIGLLLAGCGSSSKHRSASTRSSTPSTATTSGASTSGQATGVSPPAVDRLAAAGRPVPSGFPSANGRTLQQLANLSKTTDQLGTATGTFTPGNRRFAFALNTSAGSFVYAPTALYIGAKANSPALGPFLASADPTTVAAPFRSKQNSGPGGIKAIYAAQLPLPHKGTYTVLALTQGPHGLIGAPGEITVAASSPIPDVGQRPPNVATDTLASEHGNVSLLDTRVPHDDMHAVSFSQVLGKKPVALLFSTPQLCISRVCGPVTDIAVQLEKQYRDRVTFIHEEVYAGNRPNQGLRPSLQAFHLRTEPWLFTVNRNGVIAARLEGAFGVNAFRQAVKAALR